MVDRILYTDLILDFTPSTTTYPSIANCISIIKAFYIGSYLAIYGGGYTDVTTDAVIDTEGFKGFLIGLISECVKELSEEKKRKYGPTQDEIYEIAAFVPSTVYIPSHEDPDLQQEGDGYSR